VSSLILSLMQKCFLRKRENRQPNQPIFFRQLETTSEGGVLQRGA